MTISRDLGVNLTSFGAMFWQNQFQTTIPVPPHNNRLVDQLAIITGANSGLGFESAKQMLRAGLSHLILGVRSLKRGEVAAKALRAMSREARVEVWEVDMEDYPSVQAFARRSEALQRIDYVILNAGIGSTTFSKSKSGHEMSIQINYLSTVLLAVLMLPIMKAKKTEIGMTPSLSIVSSATTRMVKFSNRNCRPLLPSFDDNELVPMESDRYGISKLLGQMTFERIADQYVDASDVLITLVEPGWVKQTGLNKNVSLAARAALTLILAVAGRPVNQGAATYFDAVLNQPKVNHGSYIMNCRPAPYGDFAYSEEAKDVAATLWDETMAELKFAKVLEILESMKSERK